MPIPRSFFTDGFSPDEAKKQRSKVRLPNGKYVKPVMIGLEGETDTGKTEFILSCPGPGILIAVDRMFDGAIDNPEPPPSRRDDWVLYPVQIPLQQTATQTEYQQYHDLVRKTYYKALANIDAVSVALDGDNDWWELHQLAAFGKLTQIWPTTRYGDVYAQKRAIVARAWDSGKVVIATNKLKDEYESVIDPTTNMPVLDKDGKTELRVKTGRLVRQGFKDTDYLWQIQIRTLREDKKVVAGKTIPARYGLRIIKCKHRRELVGEELWGEDCHFLGLMTVCYPDIDPSEAWGL